MRIVGLMMAVLWMGMNVNAQTSESKLKLGDPLPQFTLNSEVYGKVTPADLKGKVVLVSLFATWCGPCQKELAEVEKTLYPSYKGNKDFRLLVIGREHTDADLKKYNERKKFTFRCIRIPSGKSFLFLQTRVFPVLICLTRKASWFTVLPDIPRKSSSNC